MKDTRKSPASRPHALSLFFPNLAKRREELAKLDAKLDQLTESPAITFKLLAVEFFYEGKIAQGEDFAKEAFRLDNSIFNCTEIIVRHCQDIQKMHQLNEQMPQAVILTGDPITDSNKTDWATYYKIVAKEKLKNKRVFSALQLFDLALRCDKTILRDEDPALLPDSIRNICIGANHKDFVEISKSLIKAGLDHVELKISIFKDNEFKSEKISLVFDEHAQIFLDNAGVKYQPNNSDRLIITLSVLGYQHLLTWEIDKNKDIITVQENKYEASPLMIASMFGRVEVVRVLIQAGANINQECSGGTALMIAAMANQELVIWELLSNKATITDTQLEKLTKDAAVLIRRVQDELKEAMNLCNRALRLFREGQLEEAIPYCRAALKADPNIFNRTTIVVRNYGNIKQLHELNAQMPQAVVLTGEPVTDENRSDLAMYYKTQAIKKVSESRYFSALRLFEEALKCDPLILGTEIHRYLPYYLNTFPLKKLDAQIRSFDDLYKFDVNDIGRWNALGLDYLQFDPIETGISQILPIPVGFVDDTKIPIKLTKKDAIELSLFNVVVALGFSHLLKWMITSIDVNGCYPKKDKIDFRVGSEFIVFLPDLYASSWWLWGIYEEMSDSILHITPIIAALLFNRDSALEYLQKNGFDLNQLGEGDRTPLMLLSELGHVKAVKYLCQQGVNVSIQNSQGTTALMIASYLFKRTVVTCLLENKAYVDARNKRGWSALMHAANLEGFLGGPFELDMPVNIVLREKEAIIRLLLSYNATLLPEDRKLLSCESTLFLDSVLKGPNISSEDYNVLVELISKNQIKDSGTCAPF